jgi:hypothetical protein
MSEDLRERLKDLESRAREARFAAEEAERLFSDLPLDAPPDVRSGYLGKARLQREQSNAFDVELKRAKAQIESLALSALIKSTLERTIRAISVLATIAVLGGSLVVSCAAVSEVSARLQARGRIDSIERDVMRGLLRPNAPAPKDDPVLSVDAKVTAAARESLASLMLYGGPLTAADISERLQEQAFGHPMMRDVDIDTRNLGPAERESTTLRQLGKLNWFDRVLIGQQRNDFLLAIVVIACAVIGSIVVGLRSGNALFEPVRFLLGLASGFIVFISLRGGRAIFMMEVSGEPPMFNPHSMAFSGLLVGLFSEKAYILLSTLVDDLFGRVRNAFKPAETQQGAHAGASGSHVQDNKAPGASQRPTRPAQDDAEPPPPKTNGSPGHGGKPKAADFASVAAESEHGTGER